MSQKKRNKLCGSCDGIVDLDVIICPYCGSDVLEVLEDPYEKEKYATDGKKKLSPDETMTSLYPPPYKIAEEVRVPTKIVHGFDDRVIPFRQSLRVAKSIEHCDLEILGKTDHMYSSQRSFERMRDSIAEFIIRNCEQ